MGGLVALTGFIWRHRVKSETKAMPSGSYNQRSAVIEQMARGIKQQTELRNIKIGAKMQRCLSRLGNRQEELPFGRPRQHQ
jgi:hypothetical protein